MNFSPHPKIHTIGSLENKRLFEGSVWVQEKVDGSQFGFGKIDGVVRCRSRGQELGRSAGQFQAAVDYVHSIGDKLSEGIIFYGEYLRAPKANRLKYNRVPKHHIVLFAIQLEEEWGNEVFLKFMGDVLDLEVIPTLHLGPLLAQELPSLLNRESFLGGHNIEGVVVRNLENGEIGKLVSDEFKEIKGERKSKKLSLNDLLDSYRTENRWAKALQHLSEDGKIIGHMKDMAVLVPAVKNDLFDEEWDEFKIQLADLFKKDFLNNSVQGLAEWYKKELANVGSGNNQKDEPSGSGETGETGRESLPVSGNPRIGLGDLPSGEGGETGEGKLPA